MPNYLITPVTYIRKPVLSAGYELYIQRPDLFAATNYGHRMMDRMLAGKIAIRWFVA